MRDAGDPVEIAHRYDEQGADELTFLDITASSDDRGILFRIIEQVAEQVFIPLTVGGGVREVQDVRNLLNAGADKVSINTSAVVQSAIGSRCGLPPMGSQCIVVAIDAKTGQAGALASVHSRWTQGYWAGCSRVGEKNANSGRG